MTKVKEEMTLNSVFQKVYTNRSVSDTRHTVLINISKTFHLFQIASHKQQG